MLLLLLQNEYGVRKYGVCDSRRDRLFTTTGRWIWKYDVECIISYSFHHHRHGRSSEDVSGARARTYVGSYPSSHFQPIGEKLVATAGPICGTNLRDHHDRGTSEVPHSDP